MELFLEVPLHPGIYMMYTFIPRGTTTPMYTLIPRVSTHSYLRIESGENEGTGYQEIIPQCRCEGVPRGGSVVAKISLRSSGEVRHRVRFNKLCDTIRYDATIGRRKA